MPPLVQTVLIAPIANGLASALVHTAVQTYSSGLGCCGATNEPCASLLRLVAISQLCRKLVHCRSESVCFLCGYRPLTVNLHRELSLKAAPGAGPDPMAAHSSSCHLTRRSLISRPCRLSRPTSRTNLRTYAAAAIPIPEQYKKVRQAFLIFWAQAQAAIHDCVAQHICCARCYQKVTLS